HRASQRAGGDRHPGPLPGPPGHRGRGNTRRSRHRPRPGHRRSPRRASARAGARLLGGSRLGASMSVDGNGSGSGQADPAAPALPGLEGATVVAQDFIEAVVWGDHAKVWQLLGAEGRTEVLEVATKRGMDEGLAARLGSDSGSPSETNEFLA